MPRIGNGPLMPWIRIPIIHGCILYRAILHFYAGLTTWSISYVLCILNINKIIERAKSNMHHWTTVPKNNDERVKYGPGVWKLDDKNATRCDSELLCWGEPVQVFARPCVTRHPSSIRRANERVVDGVAVLCRGDGNQGTRRPLRALRTWHSVDGNLDMVLKCMAI